MTITRAEAGWWRVAVLYHPRVPSSRSLADRLAQRLGERGARPQVMNAWGGEALDEILGGVDWVVALGGDGTMLRVARLAAPHRVPIIGVNFGRLGFLAELSPEEAADALPRVLDGAAVVEERIMLRCMATISGERVGPFDAVNDAFVGRGAMSRPVRLDTSIDGAPLARYVADGLIVATPTGSTAYSLSAGGPVVAPGLEAMVLTPVVPHPVPATALVLPPDSEVQAVVHTDFDAILSVDGQHCWALHDGDEVHVTRCPHPALFLRLAEAKTFYADLMERLQRGKTTPEPRRPDDR